MDAIQLKAFADLVADLVVCRLAGGDPATEDRRRTQLLRDLMALSDTQGVLPDLLPRVRQVLADHDFDRVLKEIRDLGASEVAPPDDLFDELRRLAEKLRSAQDESTYEYKLPTRVQIKIPDLVSILVEILDILKKLARRSMSTPAAGGAGALAGLVLTRGADEGPPALILLPDQESVSLAGLDPGDESIAHLAFEIIGAARGADCVKRLRQVSGGTQIRCIASPCAAGCRVLRHPRGVPADLKKVEDVTPCPPTGWVTMNPKFFYWCKCGPF
jgi:hypothetical protein